MLLRLLLPGILVLVHYSKSVVIRNGEDSTAPPGSDTATEPCTCVPFFICQTSDIVSQEDGGQCVSSNQVCCRELLSDTSIERCTTEGTTFGYCLDFKDCIVEMMPHVNTVPFPEFVARFGCGRTGPGENVKVCCSTSLK